MKVRILTFVSDPFEIEVKGNDSIFVVKQKIYLKNLKMEESLQTIVQHGKILNNSTKISDLEMKDNNDLVCLLKLKEGKEDFYSSQELQKKEELEKKSKEKKAKVVRQDENAMLDSMFNNYMRSLSQNQRRRQVNRFIRRVPSLIDIAKHCLQESSIKQITGMGFTKLSAIRALFLSKGNPGIAINLIFEQGQIGTELNFVEYQTGCKYFGDFQLDECVKNKKCTYTVTKDCFSWQKWYHCRTCGFVDDKGICESCKNICHKEHDVVEAQKSPSSFYCDCGEGKAVKFQCKCCK